mmetsp:Transcript_40005/g.61208  ORF Transcript_40005/g.61208 Transcript_40005/m.61208 type:complete len:100 (-) Transcript_40005:37-336(-)
MIEDMKNQQQLYDIVRAKKRELRVDGRGDDKPLCQENSIIQIELPSVSPPLVQSKPNHRTLDKVSPSRNDGPPEESPYEEEKVEKHSERMGMSIFSGNN